jgi:uncharacterized protein YabN with tetrapyrrole methylase and pyrophosphatase domain
VTDTVVVLGTGTTVPAAVLPAVRAATAVYAGPTATGTDFPPAPDDLPDGVVLLVGARTDPVAEALLARGAQLVEPAAGLPAAVAVMDRLRSPGGCPWDAEQTHDSLRKYLVEECFELLDALADGDRAAMREELGDVLLQVLFHARVAQEDAADPFDIDEVADDLVAKLVGRHPHVFAGGDPAVHDASTQQVRWEELKQQEKRRESCVDGVAIGQPAVALAAKLTQRTHRAKLPVDLLPDGAGTGERLFHLAATAKLADADPELELRAVATKFAADVRAAETAARAAGVDPTAMDADTWRRFWPR